MRCAAAPFLFILLCACGGAGKHLAEGASLLQAGRSEEALAVYESLLLRKPTSAAAAGGRQKAAAAHFAGLQQRSMDAFASNDLAGGESRRQEAHLFRLRMLDRDVMLAWDPDLEELREKARKARASVLYEEAERAFRDERFTDAEDLARESQKLDAERRETGYLLDLARTEPQYREAIKAMELGLWREAHASLVAIIEHDAAYKNARQLRDECRSKAGYTLSCVAIDGRTAAETALGARLTLRMKSALLEQMDPFLVLVDRDDTDILLEEQRRQLGPLYDEERVMEAGRLLGARFMLTSRASSGTDGLLAQLQLLDTESGRVLVAESMNLTRPELDRSATLDMVLDRFTRAFALRVTTLDAGVSRSVQGMR